MKIALAPSTQAAEYARNLKVAQACQPVLEAAGVECRIFASAPLPGDSTAGQSRSNREMQAWQPDLSFALHNDWIGDAKPRGVLVLVDDDHPELGPVAESIGRLAAAIQGVGFEGLRRDSRRFVFWEYAGKGGPATPRCILWERGNMASPADLARLDQTTELQGRALALAILTHFEIEEDPLAGEAVIKLLENIDRDHAAQSYRESIGLAVQRGIADKLGVDLGPAEELVAEAEAAGFEVRGWDRPR